MAGSSARTERASPLLYARVAGLLYLIIIVCGIFSEVAVRSSLIVKGDPAGTTANIVSSVSLFRIGFAADSVMLLSDVAIAVLFYVLLKPVNKTLALMAAAFRLTHASILGFNLLNYYAPMILLGSPEYAASFGINQLGALVMFFLDMHSHGYDLALLFFGFSSLILGYLVVKSHFWPGVFGYGLMAAGIVYLAGSFTRFLFPDYAPAITPIYVVPVIAETAFCLWLLVKGMRIPARSSTA
jgi:hypothetical protein